MIPEGHTIEDIKKREQIIRDFYREWKEKSISDKMLNFCPFCVAEVYTLRCDAVFLYLQNLYLSTSKRCIKMGIPSLNSAIFMDRNKKPPPEQWSEVSRRIIPSTSSCDNGRCGSCLRDGSPFSGTGSDIPDRIQ